MGYILLDRRFYACRRIGDREFVSESQDCLHEGGIVGHRLSSRARYGYYATLQGVCGSCYHFGTCHGGADMYSICYRQPKSYTLSTSGAQEEAGIEKRSRSQSLANRQGSTSVREGIYLVGDSI